MPLFLDPSFNVIDDNHEVFTPHPNQGKRIYSDFDTPKTIFLDLFGIQSNKTSESSRASNVAAIPVQGDSMEPTISNGDVVFVDTRHRVPSPPGVYALADEFGGVIVKRLEVISRPSDEEVTIRISSDNPRYNDRALTLADIHIIGRYIGRFTI